jgi:hypothetical protein
MVMVADGDGMDDGCGNIVIDGSGVGNGDIETAGVGDGGAGCWAYARIADEPAIIAAARARATKTCLISGHEPT